MVRSKLFWKLFVMYAILTIGSLMGLTVFDLLDRARLLQRQEDHRLRDISYVLSQPKDATSAAELEPWLVRLEKAHRELGVQFALLDQNGTVLVGAGADVEEIPWKSVTSGATGGSRERAAYGEMLNASGQPVRFRLAMLPSIDDSNPAGPTYLGAAVVLTNLDSEKASHRRVSLILAILVIAVALTGTYIAVRELWRPVAILTEAAHRVARGGEVEQVVVDRGSELMPLASAFNSMHQEIRVREAEYRETANLLSTVLEGMAEGVLAVDRNQSVLFANSAVGRFLRFDPQLSQGKPLREVIRHEGLREAIREQTSLESPLERPTSEVHIDGGPVRTLSVSSAALPGAPSPGTIIVLRDISALHTLEQMRQQFVANVSHELKTPLSSIKVYTETLMGGAIDDPSVNRRFLAEIESQAERLHELILDMLQLARIESGQQGMEIVPIDVADAVEISLHYFAGAAERKRMRFETHAATEVLRVLADEEGIQQILDNLIDNAVKYAPEDSCIHIRWRADGSSGIIEVEDEGPGIRSEDQDRVFERFFRVDKARSRELGSTGLGLSIVKHLARALGGNVTLKSELGVGSTFTIRLPRAGAAKSDGKNGTR